LHSELHDAGLTIVTIALDADPEAVRPFIEAAAPTHPSLIDADFSFTAAYNITNVPTSAWIDEQGAIVRPNDTIYVSDAFQALHRIDPERHKSAIRAWAREGKLDLDAQRARTLTELPDEQHELARAEFAVGRFVARERGDARAAEPHFQRAGELAPDDWAIRRGSLPIRGLDPSGPDWYEAVAERAAAGKHYYRRLDKLAPETGG
jgi:hypothetical protein